MDELNKKIFSYYKNYYQKQLELPNWRDRVNFRLNEEKLEREKIRRLEKILGKFSGKKILDVGCGTGGFLVEAKRKRANVIGLEPERQAVEICLAKGLKDIKQGKGENLPYHGHYFDIVYCYTVLEHTENPEKVISEMVRVTKKNGKIYIHTPNYLSFYEGHYKIFWLPAMPKFLAKIYLAARGRPTKFIETINYLTPQKLKQLFEKLPVEIAWIKHQLGKPTNFLEQIIFLYYKFFKIDPQIEVIIQKI